MKRILSSSRVLVVGMCLVSGITAYAQFGGFDIGDVFTKGESAAKVAKGAAGIGLKEELDLGGALAVEIAAKNGGIWKDEAATRRVATIGKALALYCTRPELNYTFAVLDSDEVNAVSAPGGYVFVTRGLLNSCKSDHQLASVLAHEIAHITRRHALRLASGKEFMKGATSLVAGEVGGGLPFSDDVISKMGVTVLEKGYDPNTELDADRHGTRLAYDAGFPPRTLRDYLAALNTENKPFSTHPSTKRRVEKLDQYLEEQGLGD
jgi:beta-barrel assembly-enhancing protease